MFHSLIITFLLSVLVSGSSGQFSSEVSHQAMQEEVKQTAKTEEASGEKPRSDRHLSISPLQFLSIRENV